MQLTTSDQWLPPAGWMVQVKERPNGMRDKTYIDPVSGCKFRSRLEVLRYLGILEPSAPKKRDGSKVSRTVVAASKGFNSSNVIRLVQDGSLDGSLDWLPYNWQVELRERKDCRVDRYYIHPVTGFKFRSKQEVRRYLKNGEMPKVQKRRVDDEEPTGHKFLFSGVKIQKRARSATRRSLFTGKRTDTSKVENDKRVLKLSDVYASDQCWKEIRCYSESEVGLLPSNVGDPENIHMNPCAEKDYIIALSAVSPQKVQVQNPVGKSSNKKPKPNPQKNEYERAYWVPYRTSRRLAGLEPELLPGKGKHIALTECEPTPEVDTGSRGDAEQPNELGKTYEEGDTTADYTPKLASRGPESKITIARVEVDTKKEWRSLSGIEQPKEFGKPSAAKNASAGYPMNLKASEDKDAPADYPMKLPSKKPQSKKAMPTTMVEARKCIHFLGTEKQPNESHKASEEKDAPADYAVKFGTGGAQSSFRLSFDESSLDPCLEFAYKTLTGIIPMENLPIKGFLPQHVTLVSPQNIGDSLKLQDLQGIADLSLN